MQTFVVRVHRGEYHDTTLKGVVEEIATGTKATFRDAAELLSILSQRVDGITDEPASSESDLQSHREGGL